jgi:Arm DNA-binding domain
VLFLRITPKNNGARFIFRIGKASVTFPLQKYEHGLGSARVPDALQKARAKADKANELLRTGVDPTDFLSGITPPPKGGASVSFGECAETFFERKIESSLRPSTQIFWRKR